MTEQHPTTSETDAGQDGGQAGSGAADAPARAPRRRATRRASAPVTTAGGGEGTGGSEGAPAADAAAHAGSEAGHVAPPTSDVDATEKEKPTRARRSRSRTTSEESSAEPVSVEAAEPRRARTPRTRKARTGTEGPAEPTGEAASAGSWQEPGTPDESRSAAADGAPATKRPARRRAGTKAPDPIVATEPEEDPEAAPEDEVSEDAGATTTTPEEGVLDVLAELAPLREAAESASTGTSTPVTSPTALLFQPPQPTRRRRAQAPAGPPRAKDDDVSPDATAGGPGASGSRGEVAAAGSPDVGDASSEDAGATSTAGTERSEEGRGSGRSRRSRGGRGRRPSGEEATDSVETDAEEEPQPAGRRGRKGAKRDAQPEEQPDAQADEGDDDTQDDSQDDEQGDQGDDARRRRRRRGGRGRRRSGGGEGEDSGSSDEGAPEDSDAAGDEGEPDNGGDAEEQGEGGSSRRRRRRRRSGRGEGAEEDVAPARARSRSRSGTSSDEVTALKGSTRLEAKRQRRREGRDAGRRRSILTEAEFLARREAVDRDMVVRERDGRVQIAVLEDKVLVEHFVSRTGGQNNGTSSSMVGNVYLGRVQNVLPSMEAAFVDLGKGRNAVLYAGEVNWDAAGLEGQPRRIEQALKSGDSVLVQVTKDPIGHKGARLTSQITLAGRYLVYVPGGGMTGISRKLPENERARLKKLLKEIVPDAAGVIVRTAAEGASDEELRLDVQRLQDQWAAIEKKASSASAPALLQGEPDLAIRVVRDIFNDDFRSLVVQGDDAWSMISEYVGAMAPDLADRVTRWTGQGDVFSEHRIDEQLAKGMDRKVWLPSGGSLVIDRTEAMTVIDVNTGKFTGAGGTLEETVTRNNLEAAEEIVRQLRLRDIGGIIVIDFIDMVLESNRDLVLRRLVECLGRDRTKHQVAEVTSLGLVQMTRKRVGQGLVEAFSETCEHCHGRGFLVRDEPVVRGGGDQSSASDDASGAEQRRSRRKKPAGSGSGAPVPVVPVLPEAREAVKATLATIAAAAAHAHEHEHEHEHEHDREHGAADQAEAGPTGETVDAQAEEAGETPSAEGEPTSDDVSAETVDVTSDAPASFDQEG